MKKGRQTEPRTYKTVAFGALLKRMRRDLGYSQRRLALAVDSNLGAKAVSNWEAGRLTGKRQFSYRRLRQLLVLFVREGYFVEAEDAQRWAALADVSLSQPWVEGLFAQRRAAPGFWGSLEFPETVPLWEDPVLPADYEPRPQDLERLLSLVLEKNSGNPVVVSGGPGVGKTTLAKALAHEPQVWERFPSGLLWAELDAQAEVDSEVRRCLEEWCGVWRLEVPPGVSSQALRDALWMRLRGERVLLVMDGARDEGLVARLHAVRSPGCCVVVIGVDSLSGWLTEQGYLLHVEPRESEPSPDAEEGIRESVGQILGRELSDQERREVEELSALLEDVPPEVRVLSAIARIEPGVLARPQGRLLWQRMVKEAAGAYLADARLPEASVGALLEAMYAGLSREEQQALRALTVFSAKAGFDLKAARAVAGQPDLEAGRLEGFCQDGWLNKADDKADGPLYHLLPHARRFLQAKLLEAGEEEAVRERHALYYALELLWEADLFARQYYDPAVRGRFRQAWAEYEAGQRWAAARGMTDPSASSTSLSRSGQAVAIAYALAGIDLLPMTAHFQAAGSWRRDAQRLLGGGKATRDEAVLMKLFEVRTLVAAAAEGHEPVPEALRALKEALSEMAERSRDRWHKLACQVEGVEVMLLSEDSPQQVRDILASAMALARQKGDGGVWYRLGRFCWRLSEHEWAERCFRQAAKDFKRLGWSFHAAMAWTDWARALRAVGDEEGSQREFDEAIALWREAGFPDLAEVVAAEDAGMIDPFETVCRVREKVRRGDEDEVRDVGVVWLGCEWLVAGLSPTWAQHSLWQRTSARYAARLEGMLRERAS